MPIVTMANQVCPSGMASRPVVAGVLVAGLVIRAGSGSLARLLAGGAAIGLAILRDGGRCGSQGEGGDGVEGERLHGADFLEGKVANQRMASAFDASPRFLLPRTPGGTKQAEPYLSQGTLREELRCSTPWPYS